MANESGALDATEQAPRARRLVQISSLTILGLAVFAARAAFTQGWAEVARTAAVHPWGQVLYCNIIGVPERLLRSAMLQYKT